MSPHDCPLCTEQYDDRTDLRVHLEVNHRKSEIVAAFIDSDDSAAASTVDDESGVPEPEPTAPSAD